jgi:hypothetical protein
MCDVREYAALTRQTTPLIEVGNGPAIEEIEEESEGIKASADNLGLPNLLTDSEDVGVVRWQSPSGRCEALLVVTGESVSLYEEDSWFITSPDDQAGIKLVPTQGTNVADCLTEAAGAVGWEQKVEAR